MIKFIEKNFNNDDYSNYERGLFIEAFVDPERMFKKKELEEDVYVFLIEVNKEFPYCVILEFDEELYFKAFNKMDEAEKYYRIIVNLYLN